jgi:hypothetical protein
MNLTETVVIPALRSLMEGGPGDASFPIVGTPGVNSHSCKGRADIICSIECDADISDVDLVLSGGLITQAERDELHAGGQYNTPTKSFRLTDHLAANERLEISGAGVPLYGRPYLFVNIRYTSDATHTLYLNERFIPCNTRNTVPETTDLMGNNLVLSKTVSECALRRATA